MLTRERHALQASRRQSGPGNGFTRLSHGGATTNRGFHFSRESRFPGGHVRSHSSKRRPLVIPLGQLTQLKIARLDEDVDSPADLDQLIDLLVNCPELEILGLESRLPSQLTKFPHGRTIHLPHLSRLCLSGSTSRIMNMLKMLKLPSSTTLHLNCISKSIHNDSERFLLPVVLSHFQRTAPVDFKASRLRSSFIGHIH